MDIESLINRMKDIYPILIDYINSTDDFDDKFQDLIAILEKMKFCKAMKMFNYYFNYYQK